ncbi:MAG: FAD-dependent oxidoreductase [Campylobacterota bacterium]|nr:FAD-dependent oxidoreductase [Campylobacterota bacterium]
MAKVAIIGGGVAGGSAALYLSNLNLDVTLFEQNSSLVSGPPFCHLHSGGNLYREIPDDECITLLHQSIDLLRFYPYAIDYRPTVVITPVEDEEDPKNIIPRLNKLQKEYELSVKKDNQNEVLGKVEEYFKIYNKEEILKLKEKDIVKRPNTLDEWMIPAAKNIDLEKIKFPVLIVQEYGLNLFRLSAGLNISLEENQNCNCMLDTKVINVTKEDEKYLVEYKQKDKIDTKSFDYLINSAGYKTGEIDDMLGFKRERFVEFKAAYVTKWKGCDTIWPEVIFHGKRGTPQGMGQFTPYPEGYFQLHGMTNEITLFDKGLVKSSSLSAQPKLNENFIKKIEYKWSENIINERTKKAINHLAKYIPAFSSAQVAAKPLYGAQQIPGLDKELRAADVTFEGDSYARCEVVKASSVLTMIDEIIKKMVKLGFVSKKDLYKRDFNFKELSDDIILKEAQKISTQREYPASLAKINTTKS